MQVQLRLHTQSGWIAVLHARAGAHQLNTAARTSFPVRVNCLSQGQVQGPTTPKSYLKAHPRFRFPSGSKPQEVGPFTSIVCARQRYPQYRSTRNMSQTQRAFRFGVVAAQARSGTEYVALAQRAEQIGYSTLLVPDTPGPTLAPFSALGVVAGATTRLRVGNWVLANDFRHPVQVAREAATLAWLSGGRLDLGLGPGREDNDYASLGLADAKRSGGVRLRKLGEALRIIRSLFSGQRVTFDGEYYHVAGASLYPIPDTPPPILIAAADPRALAQAARYADIVALGTRSRDFLARQVEWLKQAAGDRFDTIELACYTFVVPENQPAAVAAVASVVQRNFGFDLQQAVADKAPNILQGSPAAMIEQLEEHRETFGLTYIVLGAHDLQTFAPAMERIAAAQN